ncbi:MAG: hypothetical protein ABI601_06240 [bacterium]
MIPHGRAWFGVGALAVGVMLALVSVVFFLVTARTPRGGRDPVPDNPPEEEDPLP